MQAQLGDRPSGDAPDVAEAAASSCEGEAPASTDAECATAVEVDSDGDEDADTEPGAGEGAPDDDDLPVGEAADDGDEAGAESDDDESGDVADQAVGEEARSDTDDGTDGDADGSVDGAADGSGEGVDAGSGGDATSETELDDMDGSDDGELVVEADAEPDTATDPDAVSVSEPDPAADEDVTPSSTNTLDERPEPTEALLGCRPGARSSGPDVDHRPMSGRDEVAAALATRMLAHGLPHLEDDEPRDLDLRSYLDARADHGPRPPTGAVAAGPPPERLVHPADRRRNQLIGFLGLLLLALLAWLVTRPALEPETGVARDVPPVTSLSAEPTTTEPAPALVQAESLDVTVPADAVTTEIALVNRGDRPGDFELLTEPEGAVVVDQWSGTLQPGERRIVIVTADRFDGPATDWATTITLLGSGADGPQAIRVAIRG